MSGHPSEPLEPHIRRLLHPHLHPVSAGRAQSQQPGEQPGRPAVPGEQAGVREACVCGGGAELEGLLTQGPAAPSAVTSPRTPPQGPVLTPTRADRERFNCVLFISFLLHDAKISYLQFVILFCFYFGIDAVMVWFLQDLLFVIVCQSLKNTGC
ncbi:hypothetical protein COCON_G00084860 [Conger conger]|uniref:Uncharacterized protein n=1 Tax=Conger conger TaxID=82655 RepID=A0A9Q1DQH8_CONCO|nr:hypothetical protein COCON_G00084860 [Conger conger]